jgi:hypothetical protein
MSPIDGSCSVCGALLKWAETVVRESADGGRSFERVVVCNEGHRVAVEAA